MFYYKWKFDLLFPFTFNSLKETCPNVGILGWVVIAFSGNVYLKGLQSYIFE